MVQCLNEVVSRVCTGMCILVSTGQSSGDTVTYGVRYSHGDHTMQHVASQPPGHHSDGRSQPVEAQIQRQSTAYTIPANDNLIHLCMQHIHSQMIDF